MQRECFIGRIVSEFEGRQPRIYDTDAEKYNTLHKYLNETGNNVR